MAERDNVEAGERGGAGRVASSQEEVDSIFGGEGRTRAGDGRVGWDRCEMIGEVGAAGVSGGADGFSASAARLRAERGDKPVCCDDTFGGVAAAGVFGGARGLCAWETLPNAERAGWIEGVERFG